MNEFIKRCGVFRVWTFLFFTNKAQEKTKGRVDSCLVQILSRKLEVPGQMLRGLADRKTSVFFVFTALAKALKTNCAL